MSNFNTLLTAFAGLLTAFAGLILALRQWRAAAPEETPNASAYDDVEKRIELLHGTIADLEQQLRDCRRGRDKVEGKLEACRQELEQCRAKRIELAERLARQEGSPP